MGSTYGQFCPVAKAMEVLDERWTLLVVRELLAGSTRFNDVRRGVPKMSPALLSKRLRGLERAGIVRRDVDGRSTHYQLTESGLELAPVVMSLATWGVRWIGDLGEEDYDPHLLMWDIRRTMPLAQWPRGRTVVNVVFDDVAPGAARWWILVDGDQIEVCDFDPGYPIAATLSTQLKVLTRIWRGERSWAEALSRREARIDGLPESARRVPVWIGESMAARLVAQGAAV